MRGGPRIARLSLTSLHVLLFAAALSVPRLAAQTSDSLESLVLRLSRMTAVTGYEQAMADTVARLLPGTRRDRAGNVVRGAGRVLAVCPLDEPGWVVGGVRADGYVTLRRSPGLAPRQRDAQLQGARVTVWGKRRAVPGVVAVRSIHLTRGRPASGDTLFTSDSAYLDLGAASAAEVARLGVGVLSVVTLAKRPHRYGADLVASPVAGRRAACAALLDAARAARSSKAVVAFAVEHELLGRGLGTLAHVGGPFSETLIVDGAAGTVSRAESLARLGRVTRRLLPVRHGGTPVETVSLADVAALRGELVAWLEAAR